LIDLGFYKYQLFTRIQENGGYFVSRMKSNANPRIFSSNQVQTDGGIDIKGHYLGIKRTFLTDYDVYQSQALDPHVNRTRFREELWS
jgi:IS4 transposase